MTTLTRVRCIRWLSVQQDRSSEMRDNGVGWFVCAVVVALFAAGVTVGFVFGCDFMERSAVKIGAAYWVADENGGSKFCWRVEGDR